MYEIADRFFIHFIFKNYNYLLLRVYWCVTRRRPSLNLCTLFFAPNRNQNIPIASEKIKSREKQGCCVPCWSARSCPKTLGRKDFTMGAARNQQIKKLQIKRPPTAPHQGNPNMLKAARKKNKKQTLSRTASGVDGDKSTQVSLQSNTDPVVIPFHKVVSDLTSPL